MALATVCVAFTLFVTGDTAEAQSQPAHGPSRIPITWLIFVDDLHLDFTRTGRLRDAVRTIVKELIHPEDRVAIGASGPSRVQLAPTTDREAVQTAIRMLTGNALKYEDMRSAGGAAEVRYRLSTALAAAQTMLSGAGGDTSARKAMLYLSNGYGFSPSETLGELTAISMAATAAQIPIFSIHSRAMFEDTAALVAGLEWEAYLSASGASLRSLSDGTGGFAILERELVPQLGRIAEAMSR